jgi:non-specific serine/threonine protein kinase
MSLRDAVDYALGAGPDRSRPGRPDPRSSSLTKRQLEIAGLVAGGLTNRRIAAALRISERTAEGHIEQICNKLGFRSRVQIAAWYLQTEGSNHS